MLGKIIKVIDGKDGKWGVIAPLDGTANIRFYFSECAGSLQAEALDKEVSYELSTQASGIRAIAIKPAVTEQVVDKPTRKTPEPRTFRSSASLKKEGGGKAGPAMDPGEALRKWAYMPFRPYSRDGNEYLSIFDQLAQLALEENWYFGAQPDPVNPWPILENYLRYTFYKLQCEKKVLEKKTGTRGWATFNTGLVDNLYDPIFALFEVNRGGLQSWSFVDFCIPGKKTAGKRLTAEFDPLPEPAKYFDSNFEMLLDTSKEIHVDYEHVILDGVRRGRFPGAFLEEYVPKRFEWKDPGTMSTADRNEFLEKLSTAIDEDVQCTRGIKRRLEDSKVLAEKRTRWNFKTAIPQYYPRYDTMSLLLPLALVDDEVVDIALVVTRNQSGSYQGRTVLPLEWAYQNARLVCRPDSDWLIPTKMNLHPDVVNAPISADSTPSSNT